MEEDGEHQRYEFKREVVISASEALAAGGGEVNAFGTGACPERTSDSVERA